VTVSETSEIVSQYVQTAGSQPLLSVTNRYQPLPNVTKRYQPLPTVTKRYQQLPTVTNRYQTLLGISGRKKRRKAEAQNGINYGCSVCSLRDSRYVERPPIANTMPDIGGNHL
jgi:hypothetical protein